MLNLLEENTARYRNRQNFLNKTQIEQEIIARIRNGMR